MDDSTTTTTTIMLIPAWVGGTVIGMAMAGAVLLTVLQNDTISRKYVLSPVRLMTKRSKEYIYKWQSCLSRMEIKLNYYINTINNSNSNDEMDHTTVLILQTERDVIEFVQRILHLNKNDTNNNNPAVIRIGRIGKDTRSTGNNKHRHIDEREYYIWLYEECYGNAYYIIYQVPLILFGTVLADIIDTKIMFTGAFCFIADASANVASDFICNVVQTTSAACQQQRQVAVLQQPYWLICLAVVLDQNIYSKQNIIKTIYALMRLEAFRLINSSKQQQQQEQQPENKQHATSVSTILVTIPASVVPTLLPVIQETFPADRHIFAYTGCVETVQYALMKQKQYPYNRTKIPDTFDAAVSFNSNTALHNNDPVPYTIPMKQQYVSKSVYMNNRKFPTAMATLPVTIAGIVETWMSSIDAFFQLKMSEMEARKIKNSKKKQARKNKNNNNNQRNEVLLPAAASYVPYVFRLDFLLTSTAPIVTSSNNKNKNKNEQDGRYWLLRSLIQYATGSQSRELSTECMDAATSWLHAYYEKKDSNTMILSTKNALVDAATKKAIFDVVFQHKLILIANKTLQDTVVPAQHWTLLNAVKNGCACCPPDEEEDDDEEEAEDEDLLLLELLGGSKSSATAIASTRSRAAGTEILVADNAKGHASATGVPTPNSAASPQMTTTSSFVDGRMGFAFDPKRFGGATPSSLKSKQN